MADRDAVLDLLDPPHIETEQDKFREWISKVPPEWVVPAWALGLILVDILVVYHSNTAHSFTAGFLKVFFRDFSRFGVFLVINHFAAKVVGGSGKFSDWIKAAMLVNLCIFPLRLFSVFLNAQFVTIVSLVLALLVLGAYVWVFKAIYQTSILATLIVVILINWGIGVLMTFAMVAALPFVH